MWQGFSTTSASENSEEDYEIVHDFCGYTLLGGGLGACSAGSISPGALTSTPENQQFTSGTNRFGRGGAMPCGRRDTAGFFQAGG